MRAACGVKEKKNVSSCVSFIWRFFLRSFPSYRLFVGFLLQKWETYLSFRGVGWEDAIFELPGRDPVDF